MCPALLKAMSISLNVCVTVCLDAMSEGRRRLNIMLIQRFARAGSLVTAFTHWINDQLCDSCVRRLTDGI